MILWGASVHVGLVVRRFLQNVHVVVRDQRGVVKIHVAGYCLRRRIDGSGDHVVIGVDQFQHGVQGHGHAVQIQPDLGSRLGLEAVHVAVARFVQRAPNDEAKPQVVVAALFVGAQTSQELGVIGIGIDARRG